MAAERTVKVKLQAEIASYIAGLRAAGNATADFGKSVERSGTAGVAALGGLTAAAGAASVGVAAALGGAGAAFIGLGAVALRNNSEVSRSFDDLSATINSGIAQDAQPLADAFVGAAEDIGAAYQRLSPQLEQAFAASVPYVEDLTGSVTDFAENAMPGLLTAVESAGPVFEGLRDLAGETGEGVSTFFQTVSAGAEEAGAGLSHFGQLASEGLPEIGGLLVSLTDVWAEHGDEVVSTVTRILGVVNDLSGGALPVLGEAVGAAASVLDGMLDVIEPMADTIGPLIGTWLSLAAAMKGMSAVSAVMGRVSTSVATFGKSMKTARGRAKAAAGGIVGSLALIGAASSDVAGSTQPQMQALTLGLKRWAEQGQLSGEAARVLGADARSLGEAFQHATHPARGLTDGLANMAEIIPGVETYMSTSIPKVKSLDQALASMVENGNPQLAAEVFSKMAVQANAAGVSTEELTSILPQYSAAQEVAAGKTQKTGDAMSNAKPGADALSEAIDTLGNSTATTADHADALVTAWEQLFGVEVTLEEAVANFNEDLATLSETITGTKEDTNNWRDALVKANGQVNVTTEAGRTLLTNLGQQRESYLTLAQTTYDTAIKQGQSQEMATQAAREAVTKRKAAFIEEMVQLGWTEEAALGLFNRYVGTQNLGDIVNAIRQPGMAGARSNARNYMAELNALDGKTVSSYHNIFKTIITTEGSQTPPGGAMFPLGRYAEGGLVQGFAGGGPVQGFPTGGIVRGPGTGTSDSIIARVSDGEFVVNAAATKANRGLLEGINSGDLVQGSPSAGSGGGAVTHNHVTLNAPNYVGSQAELVKALRKEVRVNGGGSVQTALG